MATKYYIAKRPQMNDQHSVHREDCPFLTDYENNSYLGMFSTSKEALREGKKYFSRTTCCRFCLKEHFDKIKIPLFQEPGSMQVIPTTDQIYQKQESGLFYLFN